MSSVVNVANSNKLRVTFTQGLQSEPLVEESADGGQWDKLLYG